ncbi:site-specific recombinase XerC [Bradyrhizobium elkanii]|nr:site-specific recombinase XerC [Bradyrhizobium elkanii]MCW2153814.1 site-specific recombinase XerC [Bradyrhizobium elkanii]MCW2380354.1 site-specific recombinase XerC [Bradyrhizobium elkanii]
MTALAPHLSNFRREHLPKERRASQHTCEAYAHSFQLLLHFAAGRLKLKPSKIEIERLDAPLILAFLEHLEKQRGNSARTRNARLAAINSFFRIQGAILSRPITLDPYDPDEEDRSGTRRLSHP